MLAHPWLLRAARSVAVMVSGNAMAHLYVELDRRERAGWSALRERWEPLVRTLLARDSVDLVMLPLDGAHDRGAHARARLARSSRARTAATPTARSTATRSASAASSDVYARRRVRCARGRRLSRRDRADRAARVGARSGDIILSAAPGWDFRARCEPIPHASAHGALHRDHMLVPLLMNRPAARHAAPHGGRDAERAALRCGLPAARDLDGRSFM